jgi:hypothetical protein
VVRARQHLHQARVSPRHCKALALSATDALVPLRLLRHALRGPPSTVSRGPVLPRRGERMPAQERAGRPLPEGP